MATLFQSISQEDKVNFFVQCQALMLKHHPKSQFVIKEKQLDKALELFKDNIMRYQGYVHADENICILWNKIIISDANNANRAVTENAYLPPNQNFNAVSIDFAVFRKIEDCFLFIKANHEVQMKHVLFIREGKPKIYPIDQILKVIFPQVVSIQETNPAPTILEDRVLPK